MILDGNCFLKKKVRKRDDTIVWQCNKKRCYAAVVTDSDYTCVSLVGTHNHQPAALSASASSPPVMTAEPSSTECSIPIPMTYPLAPVSESSPSLILETFETRHGGIGVILDGHYYLKKNVRKRDDIIVWQCIKKRCSTKVETDSDYKCVKLVGTHNHEPAALQTSAPAAPMATAPQTPTVRYDETPSSGMYIYVKTKSGSTALVVNEHLFYKTWSNIDVTFWRCSQYKKTKCNCVCKVDGKNIFFDSNREHNHDKLSEKDIDLMKLRENVKLSGIERPDDKPFHVISNSIETSGANIEAKDFDNLRRVLYRHRRKQLTKPPKSKEESIELLKQLVDANHDLVQSVSGGAALIGRTQDLDLLNEDGIEIFADGTFKFAPRFFKQMYTIFVLKNGYYVPVIHMLLQDKKQKTYENVLIALNDLCNNHGIDLKHKLEKSSIMLDFELAMIKAIRSVFKKTSIRCCKFHLGQSWWRKIKELGLSVIYKNRKSAHSKWLRGIFGLAVLPACEVREIFQLYSSSAFLKNRTRSVAKFCIYMKKTYVSDTATFRPQLWAGLDANGKATNNGAEAFHRHFGDLFGYLRCKPNLPHFLRIMARYNTHKDIKLRSERQVHVKETNVNRELSLFKRKLINVRTLLYRLSMKNLPKIQGIYKRKV